MTMTILSSSLRGRRISSSVGAKMADKLNMCMEGSVAVGIGDGSRCQRPQSPVFLVLSAPFSISSPVCFMLVWTTADSSSPLGLVWSCILPLWWIDVKGLQWYFKSVFKAFPLTTTGALPMLELTKKSFLGNRQKYHYFTHPAENHTNFHPISTKEKEWESEKKQKTHTRSKKK